MVISNDKNYLYAIVDNINGIYEYNNEEKKVERFIKLDFQPTGICLSDDGQYLYLIDDAIQNITLTRYNIKTEEVTKKTNIE